MNGWIDVPMTKDGGRQAELARYPGPQRSLAGARTVRVQRGSALSVLRPGVYQVTASHNDGKGTFPLTTLFLGELTAEEERAIGIRRPRPAAAEEPAAAAL